MCYNVAKNWSLVQFEMAYLLHSLAAQTLFLTHAVIYKASEIVVCTYADNTKLKQINPLI